MTPRSGLAAALMLTGLFGLAGCTDDAPASNDSVSVSDEAETDGDQGSNDSGSSIDESIPYIDRLTPVAELKQATDIVVDGDDAWVTVPVPSTSPNARVTCTQLLLAATIRGKETLTVIYSDGVEELCEWPEGSE